MSIPIEKRIERYNAWRKREPVERPMIGLSWEPDVPPLPDMLDQVELGEEVSPEQFQPEMFLDWIESCYQNSFLYHSFHLHDTEYHQIDGLLELEELTAIQLFLQPSSGGPPLETVMSVVKRVLNSKPLLLGIEDIETVELCLNELPATGLCLMLSTKEHDPIPEEHKLWLRKHCSL